MGHPSLGMFQLVLFLPEDACIPAPFQGACQEEAKGRLLWASIPVLTELQVEEGFIFL